MLIVSLCSMGMKTERAASDFFFEESVLYFY